MLDFSTIKKIIIPEGEVKIIKDKNNNILWNRLPKEYTELEYITFNDDKCFDTLIVPNQNIKLELKFYRESNSNFYLYGVTSSGNTKSLTAYLSNSGNWRFGNKAVSFTITTNTIYKAFVDKNKVKVNNNEGIYQSVSNFTSLGNLYIGCSNENGSGTLGSQKFIGRIYYFKIYDNNNLIANLIPAKNQNNIEGFYDVERRIFLESLT